MKKNANEVFFLKKKDVDKSIKENFRQYFIGSLSNPQDMDYVDLGDLEVGTSLYQQPKADAPHLHKQSSEILYVLSGCYRVLIIDAGQEYDVCAGDFIVIPPQTAYAGKAMEPMTQTFFIKTGGNDKVTVEVHDELGEWMEAF